jgi:hypothetical protein
VVCYIWSYIIGQMDTDMIYQIQLVILTLILYLPTLSENNKDWVKMIGIGDNYTIHSICGLKNEETVITGYYPSKKGDLDLFVFYLDVQGNIKWRRTYKGSLFDYGSDVLSLVNYDNILLLGETTSKDGNFNICKNGDSDIFLLSINRNGIIESSKCIGGSDDELLKYVSNTLQNEIILFGYTSSNDGDFQYSSEINSRIFLRKINLNGDILWNKYFNDDSIYKLNDSNSYYNLTGPVVNTQDDGVIYCLKRDYNKIHNDKSILFKIDKDGKQEWKCDIGLSTISKIINTKDNGSISIGYSDSKEFCVDSSSDFSNPYDLRIYLKPRMFITKVDKLGKIEWSKCFGGTDYQHVRDIISTSDEGFIVTGETHSNDGDFSKLTFNGHSDVFIIKYDKLGSVVWKKIYGGSDYDIGIKVIQKNDNSIIIFGTTDSKNGIFSKLSNVKNNIFILQLDKDGNPSL